MYQLNASLAAMVGLLVALALAIGQNYPARRKLLTRCAKLLLVLALSGVACDATAREPAAAPIPTTSSAPTSTPGTTPDITSPGWVVECVDCPKFIELLTDRSLRLDGADRPHIAYGGDHLYYAWHDGAGWRYETVDSSPGVGRYASLALDAGDRPHISYYDAANDDLKCARWDGIAWVIETVDGEGNVGEHSSLDLDEGGHPHIAYYDATNDDLKYARWDGMAWVLQIVDSTGEVGQDTSLALDQDGHPHISYEDSGKIGEVDADLKYARWDGMAWIIETVDIEGNVGGHNSLALDAAGKPHISYSDFTDGDLNYAHWDGTAWVIETVDGEGRVGWSTSLALDASDYPRISYFGNGELKYARWDGSAWIVETINPAAGSQSSLALDGAGEAHISYLRSRTGAGEIQVEGVLKYVRVDGTAWVVETVDSAEQVGRDNSLALDAAGRPHISYTDVTNGALKYARWDGTTWLIQSVDSAVGPDSPDTALAYPSLALDGAGRAHISYSNLDDHDLKYAHWDGTAWVIHTVDRGEPNPSTNLAPAMAFTSLALDRSGHPHISYSSLGDLDIKYAHWDGTAWTTETVDGEEMAGLWGTSLALDEADHPHISYFSYLSPDATANTLRYAHWDGTAWIIETVEGAGHAGFYPSLALDRSGQPHISYDSSASVGNSSLKYAHRDDTAWIVETVVSGGISPSLALDENGAAHISYHGFTGPHGPAVGYAHWDGTAWVNETVDNVMFAFDQMAFFVSDTSLVLDEAGQPHISYHDATNGYLKYAHRFVPTESMYLPAVLSSREARVW